ncbi:ADP-ribosylation factor-binding protein GGA2 isoform X2 [Hemicordylus capensis]|uniref:ADP-ribosylation factor-binding protein GGA2 isoform X2 n=1 Tax=Hemicordylus capensis TaxID=884348 RepID=UPI00230477F6|nr:ADP-ribosylation factor-binding protein GGA2 isoform X2 [Hemicordylus capensis]
MAGAAPSGALELLLHKATDPSSPKENWESIQRFIEQVNSDAGGPTTALRLLEHKIQSPQEAEALHALTVLELCVNCCGGHFHSEMGKFRFLNGLIKVLSPKYLGEWSTDRVKARVTEVLFSWTVWFPQEVKIRDAYQMLKKQGIVKQDPKLLEDKIFPPPSPRPASSIFDADDEKSQLLMKLLKSKNPEDLQAANRMIKGLIAEEEKKTARQSRRVRAVQDAHSNAEALEEMLSSYQASPGGRVPQPALEALQELRAKCEKLKPLLFRVASETLEDEEALAEILQANDRLTRGLSASEQVVGACGDSEAGSAGGPAPRAPPELISLSEADALFQAPPTAASFPGRLPSSSSSSSSPPSLDEELVSLGCPRDARLPSGVTPPLPSGSAPCQGSLANLFVPLGSITLSTAPPVTVYERNGLKAMLHFSRDPAAASQPATRVLVLSLLSTSPYPVRNIVFQAAVPKAMAIKLQPATGSELPAYNPLQPPAVISQVLLLANPHKIPVRLRFRLLFTRNEQPYSEVGEVSGFPAAELWGGS